jgi:hypothetical protein
MANANNKYGECCGCPAFMADSRGVTIWEPTRSYHAGLASTLNVSDSNAFRKTLIEQPSRALAYDAQRLASPCKNAAGVSFYPDTTTTHAAFDAAIRQEMLKPTQLSGDVSRVFATPF